MRSFENINIISLCPCFVKLFVKLPEITKLRYATAMKERASRAQYRRIQQKALQVQSELRPNTRKLQGCKIQKANNLFFLNKSA